MIIFVDKVDLLMSEHCNYFGRRCAILPHACRCVEKKGCHDSGTPHVAFDTAACADYRYRG